MSEQGRLALGDLALDVGSREAFLRGTPLKLTRLEFDVLAYLLRQRGRAVPRQELLDENWGPGYSPESNVVDVVVASLRRKLGDDRRQPRYIVTVPAVGYRMPGEAEARPRRPWLLYVGAALVAGGLVAIVLAALGIFDSGGGKEEEPSVAGASEGVGMALVAETRSTGSPTLTGDCRTQDLQIADWQSAGTVTGDLSGRVESGVSGTLFSTAACLAGAAKGTLALTDRSGDRLDAVTDSVLSLVSLQPPPSPSALESSDILTVTGGTGKFANARGYGTCQTTGLVEYSGAPLSLTSALRSHCQLTLANAEVAPSPAGLAVRLVANPTRVGLVGSAGQSQPTATYVLAIYKNEGQRDLGNLSLTVLPVEGAAFRVTSRAGEGDQDPPLRTWRLADLRAGERQVFDFSVQFESTEVRQVPLIVRLSSPDLEGPIDSEPVVIEVE